MKIQLMVLASIVAIFSLGSCNKNGGSGKIETQKDSVSYALGVDIGASLKAGGVTELNTDLFAKALMQVLKGDSASMLMTQPNARTYLQMYFMMLEAKKYDPQLKAGRDFLEKNKSNKDVVVLPNGLQYQILTKGTGATPTDTDFVKVNYVGNLIDGREFDKSKEPAVFQVGGVIRGWTEILKLMPVGSKWKVWIPTELAYGMRPMPGGLIEPNMALIFEIELLGIEKKK